MYTSFWNMFDTYSEQEFWAIGIWCSALEGTAIHMCQADVNSLHHYHQQTRVLRALLYPHHHSVLKSSSFYYAGGLSLWFYCEFPRRLLSICWCLLPFWNSLLWNDCSSVLSIFMLVGIFINALFVFLLCSGIHIANTNILSMGCLFLKILFVYFRQRGREGEREGGKHQCVVASHVAPTKDLACNPGMCPN